MITCQGMLIRNPDSCRYFLVSIHEFRMVSKNVRRRFLRTRPIAVVNFMQINDMIDHNEENFARVLRPYHENKTPLVIQNYEPITKSDAIYCWRNLDYLKSVVGEKTFCRVEMGLYNDNHSKIIEIPFGDYIHYIQRFHEKYGSNEVHGYKNTPKLEEVIYLAQNDIFPGLLRDFPIPIYRVGEGRLYSVMFWFGPRYSVSPLHFDPLDNLLIQFVGRKRVFLFPSDDPASSIGNVEKSMWHYAGSDMGQKNTSPVNIEDVDLNKFPRFSQAPEALECILKPGDILFIPKRWWHHVRSLDTSVSANIWWR